MSKYRITLDGKIYEIEVERIDGVSSVQSTKVPPASTPVATTVPKRESAVPAAVQPVGRNAVASPMPGTILKVYVTVGDEVKKGQPVLVLEAMKMENEITAPRDGRVTALYVAQGDTVQGGDPLFEIGE